MELLDLVVERTHYVIEGSTLSKLKTSPEIYTIYYNTTHLPIYLPPYLYPPYSLCYHGVMYYVM